MRLIICIHLDSFLAPDAHTGRAAQHWFGRSRRQIGGVDLEIANVMETITFCR